MVFSIEVKVPINGSRHYELKGEEMKFVQDFAEAFPKRRGDIVDVTLMVEKHVEQVIRRAKRDMIIPLLFDNFGNMTKDYTFMDKLKDFSTITKHETFPIKEDFKELRRNLMEALSNRNKYTHGNLIYDGGLKKHFIEYEEDGKKVSEISHEIIEKELSQISNLLNPISDIIKFFDNEYRKKKNVT